MLSCKDTQELAPSLPKETRTGFDLLSKGLNEGFLYKDANNDVQGVLIALALLRQSGKMLSGNCDEVEAPVPQIGFDPSWLERGFRDLKMECLAHSLASF